MQKLQKHGFWVVPASCPKPAVPTPATMLITPCGVQGAAYWDGRFDPRYLGESAAGVLAGYCLIRFIAVYF
jgi:hypothetical protein